MAPEKNVAKKSRAIVHTMIGVVNAADRTASVIRAFAPAGIVMSAVAGSPHRIADVVVACSGGEGLVLTADAVRDARVGVDSELTVIDLALERAVRGSQHPYVDFSRLVFACAADLAIFERAQ